MAPGAKTYEDKVQGLRDLTIDCRLKRLRAKDAAAERAAAELSARAEAADHARRNRAKHSKANQMRMANNAGTNTPFGVVGMGGGNVNVAAQGPTKVHINPTPDAMLSISSPDGVDSIVIEANNKTIIEAWDNKEAMVDRPVGTLAFADGIAYIMTKGGWVNMGEALEKPPEMTNRRGAIRAQKERKANGSE